MAQDVALSLHVLDQALSHHHNGSHNVPDDVYQRLLHANSPLARLRCSLAFAQGPPSCAADLVSACKDWMCRHAACLALPRPDTCGACRGRLHWAPATVTALAAAYLRLLTRPSDHPPETAKPALAPLLEDLRHQAAQLDSDGVSASSNDAAAAARFSLGVLQRFCAEPDTQRSPEAATVGEQQAALGDLAAVWAALAPLCMPSGVFALAVMGIS